MKVLLSCSNNHPGVKTYFSHLERVCPDHTLFKPIEEMVSYVPDYKKMPMAKIRGLTKRISRIKLKKELFDFGENLLLGSWSPLYSVLIRKLNQKNIKPSILWCSTLAQSEMTSEIELKPVNIILDLLSNRKIKQFVVLQKAFQSFSSVSGIKSLTYPVDVQEVRKYDDRRLSGTNIDLFLKVRPGKNTLQQMIAQKHARQKFTLHTNIKNELVLEIARKIGISLIQHPWLPRPEYYGLIKQMKASLQVTWTESFNYAVCERMLLGIPTLVSPEVFLISENKLLRKHLVVDTPDSPKSIAQKIDGILQNEKLRNEISGIEKERIQSIAKKNNAMICEQMQKLFN